MLRFLSRKKKEADPKEELRELLDGYELPCFPAIVVTALQKIREDDVNLSDVSDLISADPGLSVHLLGTVNSAAFALRHKIKNVHQAVSLLGQNEVESILISMAVKNALPGEPAAGFVPARFWTVSARRAVTSRAVAERIDPSTRSECFTAGLLQDMAVSVLSHARENEYGPVLQRWHEGTEDLATLERETFGWDHAEIGATMCASWDFPERIAGAIEAHHTESSEGLVAVNLVSAFREVDEEPGREAFLTRAEPHGLRRDEGQALIDDAWNAADDIARLFA